MSNTQTASSTTSLAKKLSEVMAAIDHVEKRGEATKYNYVKASDIARAVREELSKRHIVMTSEILSITPLTATGRNGNMTGVTLHVRYTFRDGDTSETITSDAAGSGLGLGGESDKAIYKALTGALKYVLRMTFLIPDEAGDPEYDDRLDNESEPSSRTEPQVNHEPAEPTNDPRPGHDRKPKPPFQATNEDVGFDVQDDAAAPAGKQEDDRLLNDDEKKKYATHIRKLVEDMKADKELVKAKILAIVGAERSATMTLKQWKQALAALDAKAEMGSEAFNTYVKE